MRKSTQLQWIAKTDARWFEERTLIQRGTSEPHIHIIPLPPRRALFKRLRGLLSRLAASFLRSSWVFAREAPARRGGKRLAGPDR